MTDILTWIESGFDMKEGILLLEKYSNNPMLIRLVKTNMQANFDRMKNELCRIAGITVTSSHKAKKKNTSVSFRSQFPFLSKPDCPLELKALVTDKFTSFYAYKELHERLFDCTSIEECTTIASSLLYNYKENKMIFAELEHYKNHRHVLGIHPIFKHMHKLNKLKQMPIKDLVLHKLKLEETIEWNQKMVSKGDQQHLRQKRVLRINDKLSELEEVNRLLA